MTDQVTFMEPVCPGCGSNIIDMTFGERGMLFPEQDPLRNGDFLYTTSRNRPSVRCDACKRVFELNNENGREIPNPNQVMGPS